MFRCRTLDGFDAGSVVVVMCGLVEGGFRMMRLCVYLVGGLGWDTMGVGTGAESV